MAILLFIAKLVVSCGLLYGYYHFFLRNKRFHHYNRFYLLAAALLSLILPFLHIPVNPFSDNQQHSTFIQTLKVINAGGWEEPVIIYARQNQWARWINIQNSLCFIYIAGVVMGLVFLLRSLAWINNLKRKYPYEIIDQLKIYSTTEPGTPFSFFRSIFWDEKISFNDKNGQQIFRHEMFHVKEKHSADVLLMEILCCTCWFNPFYHLIKKEIKAIHEFLADDYAASANNRYDYAELLVAHAITQKTFRLTNPFFHNQIKRRITMITQSNLIRRSGYASRIMALPLLFLLVSAFALKITNKQAATPSAHHAAKNITVVIDAGHGGIYPGAHSSNNIAEKDITLSIAKKIKELSTIYNLNIILTRNSDALVGNATNLREDLLNRVQITTEAKANIFVSIHINAFVRETDEKTGFEAYISPKKEDNNARLLASTILTGLKDIYTVDETIQKRSVGVQVLDQNTCPAVMIQCGYITNKKDVAFITNPANQEQVARKILEGIVKYSNVQTTGTETMQPEQAGSDTISVERLAKTNPDEIKSVNYDLPKNLVTVYFKNSDIKYVFANEVKDYYTKNPPRQMNGHHTVIGVDMKNSVADIRFTKDTVPVNAIFTKVEFEPDYPGGSAGWIRYLTEHLHYPVAAAKKKIEGTVLMEFIVNTDGKISDVKAISGPEELRAASIKAIKESGTWISAMQNGKKVKAYKRQPIIYKLA